jgi:hypothetical protein
MDRSEAQRLVDEATRAFESKFKEVVEFQPGGGQPANKCPRHNLPYVIFHNGIPAEEGRSSPSGGESDLYEDAVAAFTANIEKWITGPTNTPFWRHRPAIEENERKGRNWRCRVYARCVWV